VWDIWINLHHAPEPIRVHFGDGSKFGVSIHYSEEPELLGTAGALRKLEQHFSSGFFFVVYGDNDIDLDYGSFAAGRRGPITILAHHRDYVAESGVLDLAADNRILRSQEQPTPGSELSHSVRAGARALRDCETAIQEDGVRIVSVATANEMLPVIARTALDLREDVLAE